MDAKKNLPDLDLAFDVGHSSIGWAVLKTQPDLDLLGCGTVIFRADDCLASKRRDYRRQRRHIRSTRQRIRRLKVLLAHLGGLTPEQLNKPGCAWPWKLAARVLVGGTTLAWPELWDVLRWYAHNRGYDANRRWSAHETDEKDEDAEKVQNAHTLMDKHGKRTMAETVCAVCGVDPLGLKSSSNPEPAQRFRAQNAAFPRKIVEEEVGRILQAHFGKLDKVDQALAETLFSNPHAILCPAIKLPRRFAGGLLFGQLVPRFDNRIISKCLVTGQKVPSRNTPEFLNFRWGMLLANVRVVRLSDRELTPLTIEERRALDEKMRSVGSMTEKQFKDAVYEVAGAIRSNLETMFMEVNQAEALVLDPVQKTIMTGHLKTLWPLLSDQIQKRARGQLRRRKSLRIGDLGADSPRFSEAIDAILAKKPGGAAKRMKPLTRESILEIRVEARKLDGRAAYARTILRKAFEEVMAGKHPKEEGGCLFVTEQMRQAQMEQSLAQQTNNHLVRHRLLILGRLFNDILKEYAQGDKARISKLTVEVNRDLREMSGKTTKEVAQDLGSRLANHRHVAEKLAEALGPQRSITAGLIRKARIADDLGWTCPYTGQKYEPVDLVTRRVDKDHIVPRAERASDSLDSLAITFSAVNRWKGRRTAFQFIQEEQGKAVPDLPNLSVLSLSRYQEFVNGLEVFRGHNDDKKRKKRRKTLLLLPEYNEPTFTPRDLTVTSQLVRLAAQVLRKEFDACPRKPMVVSIPGSVTGEVRKAWNALGCLSKACPQVLDEAGKIRTKTEIRDLTHLHHALDACILGLTSHHIPNNGHVWQLLTKRTLNPLELAELKALGIFTADAQGRAHLNDLSPSRKEQIRQRLAEKRVAQHIPKRISGLRVEQNTWRVRRVEEDQVFLEQRIRQPDGTRLRKEVKERAGKLMGLNPGKLQNLKGALVIGENFGVALDPAPAVIPFHKVWPRLMELKAKNGGRMPRLLRNGQIVVVPRGRYQGTWRIFSAKASLTLDLGTPDKVRLESRGEGQKREVQIGTLIRDGMAVPKATLTGIASAPPP